MLDPEVLGRAMLSVCLDGDKYPSGTILEVADPDDWRAVNLLNDPGPQGKATAVSQKDQAVADIKAILEDDRRGGKR
jgi:hypothetical protein